VHNKPSEFYPNTLPSTLYPTPYTIYSLRTFVYKYTSGINPLNSTLIPYPLYPTPYIYSLRTFVYIYQIYIYIPSGIKICHCNLREKVKVRLIHRYYIISSCTNDGIFTTTISRVIKPIWKLW
jgi:hypothetical protein